jgi:CRP-like cAMP-binding protein
MAELAILQAFTGHAFLEGLSEHHRMRLATGVKPFEAGPGDYLTREGAPAIAFYLIQSGQVAIGTHLGERGTVPLQTVGPGDVVGWSWLVPPYQWQFDARAQDEVRGLLFDAAWLRAQCEEDHELGYRLLQQLLTVVSRRLTASRIRRLDIYK